MRITCLNTVFETGCRAITSHFAVSVLLALTNNVDNVGVCIAYSIAGIRLEPAKNLWVSLLTFFISALFAVLGSLTAGAIGKFICQLLSAAILTVLGLLFLFEPLLKKIAATKSSGKPHALLGTLFHPENSDADGSKSIDFREATLLGVSLSVNNAGACLGAGVMGVSALLIGILSAVVSFVSLWAGNRLAPFFIRHNFGRKASVAAGALLILVGLRQLF